MPHDFSNPIIDPSAPQISAAKWTPNPDAGAPLLILLHGYGSDEHDLYDLIPYLNLAADAVCLGAPLSPPHPLPGRSWYPITDLADRDPGPITQAAQSLLFWIDQHVAQDRPVALLGFSQGGAVSLQALRLAPERFGAVVNLAGYATPGELSRDSDLPSLRPHVFWGRGDRDEVIPAPLIAHTSQWLPAHANLTERVYPGVGHSVCLEELRDVSAFLRLWQQRISNPEIDG